jgi:hypothetical protein
MITITALSGPYAGEVREVSEGFDPRALLTEFASHDWKWRVDYSRATERETLLWGRADMVARIIAALLHGRTVTFDGATYRADRIDEIERVVGEVEDAIAESGYMVRVERDDEEGVVIGTGGTEHMVQ